MAGIDKASIAVSIAIVAIALGVVAAMDATQSAPSYTAPVASAPTVSTETAEPEPQADPFAGIAEKVKSGDDMMEKETVELEEEIMMEKRA